MVKIIVLIIDSDTEPVYAYNRAVWRSYRASDPDIRAFFIRMDESAPEEGELRGDTLFFKGKEGFIPAILQKTVAAFEYAVSHLSFDFILRTNLSSFYILPEFKKMADTLPRNRYYGGVIGHCNNTHYASGAGFVMSKDTVQTLIENKQRLPYHIIDDVAIGSLMTSLGYAPLALTRYDLCANQLPPFVIPSNMYHIRVKNERNRLSHDRACMKYLLDHYYGITLAYD
jgi:hypothetical protein